MGRFDRQIATALRLIEKNGELCQVTRETRITDPDKPWETTPGPVETHDAFICFLPMDRTAQETFVTMKGSEVPTGATQALMGAVDFVMADDFTVVRSGNRKYRIASIDELQPNQQTQILYTMVLAGG